MAKQLTVDEVDAFMRRLKLMIGGVVALFVVPLVISAFYVDRRLDEFEDSLRYRPPMEAEDSADENIVHHVASEPVQGQIVYVPAYSHIYHGDGDPYLLTITLSIRNTSMRDGIDVNSVRYFDTKGKEVRSYLRKPVRLGPLATTEILVERDDASGGSGANFLVEWAADRPVPEPIIEAVMIDTDRQQGISFARQGVVIHDTVPKVTASEPNGSDSVIQTEQQ